MGTFFVKHRDKDTDIKMFQMKIGNRTFTFDNVIKFEHDKENGVLFVEIAETSNFQVLRDNTKTRKDERKK